MRGYENDGVQPMSRGHTSSCKLQLGRPSSLTACIDRAAKSTTPTRRVSALCTSKAVAHHDGVEYPPPSAVNYQPAVLGALTKRMSCQHRVGFQLRRMGRRTCVRAPSRTAEVTRPTRLFASSLRPARRRIDNRRPTSLAAPFASKPRQQISRFAFRV